MLSRPELPEDFLGDCSLGQLWPGLDTMNPRRFTSLHRPHTAIGHADDPIGTIGVGFGYDLVFGYAIKLGVPSPSSGSLGIGNSAEKDRHYLAVFPFECLKALAMAASDPYRTF